MSSEIVIPKPLDLFGRDNPARRLFSRWYKPEYTVLASKFVGGVVAGGAEAYVGEAPAFAKSNLALGLFCLSPSIMPALISEAIDITYDKELRASVNPISPSKMATLSSVASYTGYMVGLGIGMLVHKDRTGAVLCQSVFDAQSTLAMISYGAWRSVYPRRPPSPGAG